MENINIENIGGYTLNSIRNINILMGKNGCGKSVMMRSLEKALREKESFGNIVYISPERGGGLKYNSSVAQNMSNQIDWHLQTRGQKNRTDNFKEQTYFQFNKLELATFRDQQEKEKTANFIDIINKINDLLDNIEIKQEGQAFAIYNKHEEENKSLDTDSISSGESELVSLAIECLVFYAEKKSDKSNILFLDEPDVHLHPDLQVKFMNFLQVIVKAGDCKIIIATHSTPILGAFENYVDVGVCFMTNRQKEIDFENITDVYKKILPVFGAHPLSNIFNSSPILILEGEDDVRIWQQVVRSSENKIKLYPCVAGSKDEMNEMEKDAEKILRAVYDKGLGFSLRDRDDEEEKIGDEGLIKRFRTSCRNAENLILSDEALKKMNLDWEEMQEKISNWIDKEKKKREGDQHQNLSILKEFQTDDFDRKNFDLKEVRNDLMHIAECNKPWEVIVGQAIAENKNQAISSSNAEGKIFNFLGENFVNTIFK
ncbi:MAG: AAA family ATPase [Candidatus Moranbacteria bacterium]|nr:AAA family ATPase [Candidatus Moranbacteria bacterium]